jgi:hypothetical protein
MPPAGVFGKEQAEKRISAARRAIFPAPLSNWTQPDFQAVDIIAQLGETLANP